jgi:hypothetical protein
LRQKASDINGLVCQILRHHPPASGGRSANSSPCSN